MDSKVSPKLPREVDWKLTEIGFQQLNNSYPKLDVKVKSKLKLKSLYSKFEQLLNTFQIGVDLTK